MRQLLEQAWKRVNNPTLLDPFSGWLTNEQKSLLPPHFDVIAAVYLNTTVASEYAHISNLAAQIRWLKKGEVSQVASSLVARGYLAERWLTEEEWSSPGSRPRVFRLTDRCVAPLFGHSTSPIEICQAAVEVLEGQQMLLPEKEELIEGLRRHVELEKEAIARTQPQNVSLRREITLSNKHSRSLLGLARCGTSNYPPNWSRMSGIYLPNA